MLVGKNRPTLKLLNKYVKDGVSHRWHDLGLELLDSQHEEKLNEIKCNYPNNVGECCKEVFRLWLNTNDNATWNSLIQALKEIKLNSLSTTIKGMLISKKPKAKMDPPLLNDSTGME